MEWYYATLHTLPLDLTSGSDFTVANEPVIILTSDTVVERDEPTFVHSGVPRNFVWGVQQIQLRTEDRENGDLGAVDP